VKLVIFGLSITSSWGNGHATTFRALARALHRRGHRIVFFERDQEWYASNRDMPEPPFCDTQLYEHWTEVLPRVRRELSDCQVAMVGSYFPDAMRAIPEVFDSNASVKSFYDIDTPITLEQLRSGGADYLKADQIPGFDLYFSFTGGPLLRELETKFGAKAAVPLYCSVDAEKYWSAPVRSEYQCDFSYMGTYAADRQPKIEELLCAPARQLPKRKFLVAGPQYPANFQWPENVVLITHLEPRCHASFYSSSRFTLNVTRREMVLAGYSPSVRLFEAAACGTAIVSDTWPGLDSFFAPGQEILLPASETDVVSYIKDMAETEIREIGRAAQQRVLAGHTSEQRAIQFEKYVEKDAMPAQCRSSDKASIASSR
jgi:spore maturation protein CgeB